jgi:hypothetical protein
MTIYWLGGNSSYLASQEADNSFPIRGFLHTLSFHAREFVARL